MKITVVISALLLFCLGVVAVIPKMIEATIVLELLFWAALPSFPASYIAIYAILHRDKS